MQHVINTFVAVFTCRSASMYIVHWRPVNSGTAQANSDVSTRCRGNAAIVNRDLLPALVLPTAAYYDWKLYDRVAHQSSWGRPSAIQAGGSCFRRHFCLLLSIQWRCSPPVGRSLDATLSFVMQQLCNSCATVVQQLLCNNRNLFNPISRIDLFSSD